MYWQAGNLYYCDNCGLRKPCSCEEKEGWKMGAKYEVRIGNGESHFMNSWWDYIMFRFRNRGNILYIRINYF